MKLGNPLKRVMAIFGRNSGKTAEAAAAIKRFENVPVPQDPPRRHRRQHFDRGGQVGFGQSYGQKLDRAKGWLE